MAPSSLYDSPCQSNNAAMAAGPFDAFIFHNFNRGIEASQFAALTTIRY